MLSYIQAVLAEIIIVSISQLKITIKDIIDLASVSINESHSFLASHPHLNQVPDGGHINAQGDSVRFLFLSVSVIVFFSFLWTPRGAAPLPCILLFNPHREKDSRESMPSCYVMLTLDEATVTLSTAIKHCLHRWFVRPDQRYSCSSRGCHRFIRHSFSMKTGKWIQLTLRWNKMSLDSRFIARSAFEGSVMDGSTLRLDTDSKQHNQHAE